jgi:hypothetical protein
MMLEPWELTFESELVPTCIALRTKENCTLVVINTMYFIGEIREICAHLATHQPR